MRQTGDSALIAVANLLVATLIVRLALDRLTADLVVVLVSKETCSTATRSTVALGSALGVPTAQYQVAGFVTFSL